MGPGLVCEMGGEGVVSVKYQTIICGLFATLGPSESQLLAGSDQMGH